MMIGRAKWFLILALAAGSSIAATTPPPEAEIEAAPVALAANSLDALFNDLGIPFNNTGDGWYKASFPKDDGTSVPLIFNVNELGTLDDGTKVATVSMYLTAVTTPSGYNVSPAVLKKISDLNSNLNLGSVIHIDGTGFFYHSTFWLTDANARTLYLHMLFGVANIGDITNAIRPFVSS